MTDNTWRLLVDKNSYADFSVSVSPAVEKAVVNGDAPPTIFLNVFDQDSITVGVNEDPEQVLNLEFCRDNNIDFRRRVNGGGAIYTGTGSAFMVYFVPTSHPDVPETTAEAFPKILTAFAETLSEQFGFPAEYRPLNDVQVEGRKLVPTSLKIENGVMTFRFVVNVKEMNTEIAGTAMPMPPEKVQDKVHKDLQSRFTCLEREAGREISAADLEQMARAAVAHAFSDITLEPGALTDAEHGYAKATTDLAAMLADPEVDAVVVSSPSEAHVEHSFAAIAAGKHVLIEIPIAIDLAGAKRVAEAAEAPARIGG